MKLYHGTNSDFDRFSMDFAGQNTDDNATDGYFAETARLGYWFTDNKEMAQSVYDKVLTCEVAIGNPYAVNSLATLANWFEMTEKSAKDLVEMLKEQGYDGIVIEYDAEFEGMSAIAFDAEQITIL